jgi:predicted TIM-barrel fold metal-dependent hydrolase
MEHRIIDFHAHAFPDALAPRAMKALLEEAPGVKAYLDGTMADLVRSMDRVGIEKSVVCCIATKPAQFEAILTWCMQSRSDRLIFFPSVHPADPSCREAIRRIREEGFQGVKLHPYYQDFVADEDRMLGLYEEVSRQDLILVMHTGYDIAFPRIPRADPQRLVGIKELFPELKLVTTHLGAWEQWDEVRQWMIGREIYMEVSFAMDGLPGEQARQMIVRHPDEYVLFGTDSPWTDQAQTLAWLKKMGLAPKKIEKILSGNAERLLGLHL